MKQAVANDGIKAPLFESRIRQVMILQGNSRFESRLPNTTPPESQHGFGTIDTKSSDSRQSLDESHRHIRRPASKVDYPPPPNLPEPTPKPSRNFLLVLPPIVTRPRLAFLLVVDA